MMQKLLRLCVPLLLILSLICSFSPAATAADEATKSPQDIFNLLTGIDTKINKLDQKYGTFGKGEVAHSFWSYDLKNAYKSWSDAQQNAENYWNTANSDPSVKFTVPNKEATEHWNTLNDTFTVFVKEYESFLNSSDYARADLKNLFNEVKAYYDNDKIITEEVNYYLGQYTDDSKADFSRYPNYPYSAKEFSDAYVKAEGIVNNQSTYQNYSADDINKVKNDLNTQYSRLKKLVDSGTYVPVTTSFFTEFSQGVANTFKSILMAINTELQSIGNSFSEDESKKEELMGFNFGSIVNEDDGLIPIFKGIGYSLVILFLGINVISTSIQYELFTLKGGVKVLGGLFLSKLLVDIAATICKPILSTSLEWTQKVLELSKDALTGLQFTINYQVPSSNIVIIGGLIDWLNTCIYCFVFMLIFLPPFFFIIAILVKVFLKNIEISMLICVSPAFFACICGDATKTYFKKFISTYISVTLEFVFIAIVYYIYCKYTSSVFNDFTVSSIKEMIAFDMQKPSLLTFSIVSCGAFILMIKTPRVLKSLVETA